MLNLGTATPAYPGTSQQSAADNGGGLLGALGLFFGSSSTPAYAGSGQPQNSGSGSLLGNATPAYQPAPPPATTQPPPAATAACAPCPPCPPVDLDPFGSGPIAIVIQRDPRDG